MKYQRIITIVLDSLGVGAMPDAAAYGDLNTDTLGNMAKAVGGINVPNLEKLGLGNLHPTKGVKPQAAPLAYYSKMLEKSIGKDTMTGHWEMMGLFVDKPFITFTENGFPSDLVKELEEKCGHKTIGNYSASGTEIIEELGERHIQTNEMILYTSADSVLQIACSEETFGLEELYRCCEIAREITMKDKWKVGRVIARPFIGKKKGEFKRTSNRHDYALKPSGLTALDFLKNANLDVISVGKIYDIFDSEGITESHKTKSNQDGMEKTIALMDKDFKGLLYVNLVDFDALWGHRRNPKGYVDELERFDKQLNTLLSKLRNDDLLILTADHGNDPTHVGSDHTREMVPLLMYSPSLKSSGLLPQSDTFADIAMTITDNFKTQKTEYGVSLLKYLV
ncbi:MAG: phosphopentomutase [Erysipelotrichaceae bacterium]|nr:phosphopentomutase [Erysipelotrichaceae bacterium]